MAPATAHCDESEFLYEPATFRVLPVNLSDEIRVAAIPMTDDFPAREALRPLQIAQIEKSIGGELFVRQDVVGVPLPGVVEGECVSADQDKYGVSFKVLQYNPD